MSDTFGADAAMRAGAILAAGNVVRITDIQDELVRIVCARAGVTSESDIPGQKRANLNSTAGRDLKASAIATKRTCWLCETDLSDIEGRTFEKDSIMGGNGHTYHYTTIATSHAYCNRVRGILQSGGWDLADIVDKARNLPKAVRATYNAANVVKTDNWDDLI